MTNQTIARLAARLRDAQLDSSLPIGVDEKVVDQLAAGIPGLRFTGLAGAGALTTIIVYEPTALSLEALESVRAQLADRGTIFARFRVGDAAPESLAAAAEALQQRYVCRGLNLDPAVRTAGVTPWTKVTPRLPRAWLFLGSPHSGKTSALRDLGLRSGMPVIHGDDLLMDIARGRLEAPGRLREVVAAACDASNLAAGIEEMFEAGLFGPVADHISRIAGPADFCFEMFVPVHFQRLVGEELDRRGYFAFMPNADLLEIAEDLSRSTASLEQVRLARAELAAIRASTSWRLTAPLRKLVRRVGGAKLR